MLRINAASRLAALLAAIALALPVSLSAQDFVGQWELTRETPRGAMTQIVTIVKEGDGYAGTVVMRQTEIPLEDVTVEGDTISFVMNLTMGGRGGGGQTRTMTQSFRGTLDGDVIQGEMEGPRGTNPVTLTRVEG